MITQILNYFLQIFSKRDKLSHVGAFTIRLPVAS